VTYEAVELPRGNVVVSMPSRDVFGAFPSMQEARAVAQQLNAWLERDPDDLTLTEVFEWESEGDLVQRLERILDKLHGPAELWAQAA
jgi:hypothetical protein